MKGLSQRIGPGGLWPSNNDIARAETPEQRKIMLEIRERAEAGTTKQRKSVLAMRLFTSHFLAHPIDPGPMREAQARGDTDAAVSEAIKYGVKLGGQFALFGLDAIAGREFLKRMADARAAKGDKSARNADWQARADIFWSENPGSTAGKVAQMIHAQLIAEGREVLETKTIRNIIRKTPKIVSRLF